MRTMKYWPLAVLVAAAMLFCSCKEVKPPAKEKPAKKEAVEKKPAEKPAVKKAEAVKCPVPEDYVRPCILAGSWYPSDRTALQKMVNGFLAKAQKKALPGRVVGITCPHAGYKFSGPAAAYSYKQIAGQKYDTVVMIGLCHRGFTGLVSVFPGGSYETPLGKVKVDSEIAMKILNSGKPIRFIRDAHLGEHCLEIQLPFLQTVLKEFKIVPILMSGCTMSDYEFVSHAVAKACEGKNVLLLASTDLSHYPRYEDACRVDKETLESWKTMDPEVMLKLERKLMGENVPNLACTMCAKDALITTIMTAKLMGADKVEILKYQNSGDTAGDKSRVVGYGAAAILDVTEAPARVRPAPKARTKPAPKAAEKKTSKKCLEDWEKTLLRVAREAVEAAVKGKKPPAHKFTDPKLTAKQGAFVTLRNPKMPQSLRGCIGRFVATGPLYKVVQEMAVAAATQDRRFRPVQPSELKDLDIEISVLSPLQEIKDPMKIELGKHGIEIVNARLGRSGCFLPQVATETGWTKEEFLNNCCLQKAGLPPDAWKNDPDTKVYVFTAHIIHE